MLFRSHRFGLSLAIIAMTLEKTCKLIQSAVSRLNPTGQKSISSPAPGSWLERSLVKQRCNSLAMRLQDPWNVSSPQVPTLHESVTVGLHLGNIHINRFITFLNRTSWIFCRQPFFPTSWKRNIAAAQTGEIPISSGPIADQVPSRITGDRNRDRKSVV